ncbi:MAG: hypothetical protein JEZ00_07110 [Anaerolineaceae bacterium]|nr:hypothetical protein [Anaerolineaceae bacterium]
MLTTLELRPSFGFGDRLGLATPGHIAAVKGTNFAPIFAQQSVRENARTRRTPQQVMDDALRAVEAAGWDAPWGADADHLKTVADMKSFVDAGFTFFTVDPGDHVDNAADIDSIQILREKTAAQKWEERSSIYLASANEQPWGVFNEERLLRAIAKYGKAIDHTIMMYQQLKEMKDSFDFEASVDETEAPTTPLEHYFIVNELTRAGVNFTSLAPRFIGRFEKGVDYIGDLDALDIELAKHAAVTKHFSTYKLSLHSGSDKFSVYPLIAKHWGKLLHVKTAGTSYLEALRTLAVKEPALFGRIWKMSLEKYPAERATYHVSGELDKVQAGLAPADLLNDFHARQILHVTFGSALILFGNEIHGRLKKHADAYTENLQIHFAKHLDLLK